MNISAAEYAGMRRALVLAARGRRTTHPNPRVGCVILRDGEVVGEGWHERPGEPHAEIHALRAAGDRARGATVCVTLEPCAHHGRTGPCCEVLAEAGVGRVVAAVRDPNPQVAGRGLAHLEAAGIETAVGPLAEEAEVLNRGFFSRMSRGRPWVTVKLAASLDGRTAMASGESRWISGEAARDEVHRLRAESSAVMTGVGTVLADAPRLTPRLGPVERQPDRVVLDSALRTPPDALLLDGQGRVIIVGAANADPERRRALETAGAIVREAGAERPEPDRVLALLASEYDCNEVLVEAGPVLAGALLQAGLVDEIRLFMAPHLMGDAARGLFALPGLERMADRLPLEIVDLRRFGAEIGLTLRPDRPGDGED